MQDKEYGMYEGKFSFLHSYKRKFNENELNELEQLSLEFQKEFC